MAFYQCYRQLSHRNCLVEITANSPELLGTLDRRTVTSLLAASDEATWMIPNAG